MKVLAELIASDKEDFLKSLEGYKRIIHLRENGGIVESITSVLVLAKNCIEHQSQKFELVYSSASGREIRTEFPGKAAGRKLAILFTILKYVLENKRSGTTSTVRDVFYGNPQLYKRQVSVVDCLKLLKVTWNIPNSDSLCIVPAQKGLVWSPSAIDVDGVVVESFQSNLIPYLNDKTILTLDDSKVVRVLVIEKEAIYHKLVKIASAGGSNLSGTILVTGKGYPDFLSRLFLHKLQACDKNGAWNWSVVADADPHGMNIALNYIFNEVPMYTCGKLEYQGVYISRMIAENLKSNKSQLLDLSQNDISLTVSLLNRLTQNRDKNKDKCIQQSQRILYFAKKAEMNSLYT